MGVVKLAIPEHEKLQTVQAQSQAVGDFIVWLQNVKGVTLAKPHEHKDSCESESYPGFRICDYTRGELMPFYFQVTNLLAEFFSIDLKKLEEEKLAMLAEIKKRSEAKP